MSLPFSPTNFLSRRNLLVASVALTGSFLTACSDSNSAQKSAVSATTSPSNSATTPASTSPSATPTTAAPETLTSQEAAQVETDMWLTGHSQAAAVGNCGVETAVRTGTHADYDRIVIQTSGTGTLGWDADIVTAANTQGKGDSITLAGAHLLRVYGLGTSMATDEATQKLLYSGATTINVDAAALKQVYFDHTYEGQFQVVAGVESTKYRIFTLQTPTRLVIDIAH